MPLELGYNTCDIDQRIALDLEKVSIRTQSDAHANELGAVGRSTRYRDEIKHTCYLAAALERVTLIFLKEQRRARINVHFIFDDLTTIMSCLLAIDRAAAQS